LRLIALLLIFALLTYQSPTFSILVISTLALSLSTQFSVPLPQSIDFLSRTRYLWHQKTRVLGLSYGVVYVILRLVILYSVRL